MLFSTIGQIHVFVWMLGAGVAIGAWYACLAGLRHLLRAGVWLSLIADVAFGAGAAVLFCLALITANYGRVRLFAVLAAALGFALFAAGVYPPGRRAIRGMTRWLCRIFVKIGQLRWIKVIFR